MIRSAVFRPFRWPGLIWAVPLAALGIVAWLGLNAWDRRGPVVTASFPIAGGLKAGTTEIKYREFTVGEVREVRLSRSLDRLIVRLDFISSMAGHLGPGTRYWIAGETLDLANLASVKALLSGPYIGVDPKPGKTVASAAGLAAAPDLHPPQPGAVAYSAVFSGGPSGLKPGAEVDLEGSPAGHVARVGTAYDPSQKRIVTRVAFVLQPQQIALEGEKWNMADPKPQMDAMIAALVGHGLRAQLGASVPVVGEKILELKLIKSAAPAALDRRNPPEIPALESGPDLEQLIAHVDDLSRQADTEVPALLQRLEKTTAAAEGALAEVQSLLSAERMANVGPGSTDLPHALYELSRAAQSLRELTDFLNSHPNALLFGRQH